MENAPTQIIRVFSYDDQPSLRAIRNRVFVEEQSVPAELEHDDRDAACVHVLAEAASQAVGTARMDVEKAGKIGRVAVLAEYRGRGIGVAMMHELHAIALEHSLRSVWLNAQKDTVGFYEKLGYTAVGGEFVEAGIVHLKMECALKQ